MTVATDLPEIETKEIGDPDNKKFARCDDPTPI